MEALHLNLKFAKVFKVQKSYEGIKFGKVMKAKGRGFEFFNFDVCQNCVHLGDLECLLCVHNVVCVCVCIIWYVCA